jgi:hypothetical protein
MNKINWKLALTAAFFLAGLAALELGNVPRLQAENADRCALGTLSGAYRWSVEGFIQNLPDPAFVPVAEAGVAIFDGRGGLSASSTFSFGGNVFPVSAPTSSYTVNPDCTGSLTFNTDVASPVGRNLVIGRDGHEIEFINTNSGHVIAGTMKKN